MRSSALPACVPNRHAACRFKQTAISARPDALPQNTLEGSAMPTPASQTLPGIEDVHAAAARFRADRRHETGRIQPHSMRNSEPHPLQAGNPAAHRLLQVPRRLQQDLDHSGGRPQPRRRGVSSGNHAQGVAASAAMFGVDAVIAMPYDAPAIKVDNVRQHGRRSHPLRPLRRRSHAAWSSPT